MRLFPILILLALPCTALAAEAPPGQVRIDAGKVLRGRFVEERQIEGLNDPLHFSGHFVAAPQFGLIWGIEAPFPTSTIVTSNGAVQDVGGIGVKLKIKKLSHLYQMIGEALAGDWSPLETDFSVTRKGNANHWLVLLTPRPDKASLPYAKIVIGGSRYVETIVMTKTNGVSDALSFTDEALSPLPLTSKESASFNEAGG